jgi:uncharacterized membrane protein YfcA
MTLLAVPFGILIGLIVGTVGGGGAILALPVLVYVLGEDVNPASTGSLIVVALAASVGAGARARRGDVCARLAIQFSIPAAAGSLAGTVLGHEVSPQLLILTFVPVMALAAVLTWRRACSDVAGDERPCPDVKAPKVVLAGALVGVLTGFFGVGGGFVIVPVLTLWFGMSFRRAVGTSLVIITITGVAALASHVATGTTIDVPITAALAGGTMLGALVGSRVSDRLPQRALGQAFALVVGAVALFLLVDTLALGGPPGS